MPAAVGAGTFWDEMVAFVGGEKDADEAATAIEESWRE
jgi:alpha-glucoside transport system substrate-binding protein